MPSLNPKPRWVAALLCLALVLPSPAYALRPELDHAGVEQALNPAAGAEQKGLLNEYNYLTREEAHQAAENGWTVQKLKNLEEMNRQFSGLFRQRYGFGLLPKLYFGRLVPNQSFITIGSPEGPVIGVNVGRVSYAYAQATLNRWFLEEWAHALQQGRLGTPLATSMDLSAGQLKEVIQTLIKGVQAPDPRFSIPPFQMEPFLSVPLARQDAIGSFDVQVAIGSLEAHAAALAWMLAREWLPADPNPGDRSYFFWETSIRQEEGILSGSRMRNTLGGAEYGVPFLAHSAGVLEGMLELNQKQNFLGRELEARARQLLSDYQTAAHGRFILHSGQFLPLKEAYKRHFLAAVELFQAAAGTEQTDPLNRVRRAQTMGELDLQARGKLYEMRSKPALGEVEDLLRSRSREYGVYGVFYRSKRRLWIGIGDGKELVSDGLVSNVIDRHPEIRRRLEIHNHPSGPNFPSGTDFIVLENQLKTLPPRRRAVRHFVYGPRTGWLIEYGIRKPNGRPIPREIRLRVWDEQGRLLDSHLFGGTQKADLSKSRHATSDSSAWQERFSQWIAKAENRDGGEILRVELDDSFGDWVRWHRQVTLASVLEKAGLVQPAAGTEQDLHRVLGTKEETYLVSDRLFSAAFPGAGLAKAIVGPGTLFSANQEGDLRVAGERLDEAQTRLPAASVSALKQLLKKGNVILIRFSFASSPPFAKTLFAHPPAWIKAPNDVVRAGLWEEKIHLVSWRKGRPFWDRVPFAISRSKHPFVTDLMNEVQEIYGKTGAPSMFAEVISRLIYSQDNFEDFRNFLKEAFPDDAVVRQLLEDLWIETFVSPEEALQVWKSSGPILERNPAAGTEEKLAELVQATQEALSSPEEKTRNGALTELPDKIRETLGTGLPAGDPRLAPFVPMLVKAAVDEKEHFDNRDVAIWNLRHVIRRPEGIEGIGRALGVPDPSKRIGNPTLRGDLIDALAHTIAEDEGQLKQIRRTLRKILLKKKGEPDPEVREYAGKVQWEIDGIFWEAARLWKTSPRNPAKNRWQAFNGILFGLWSFDGEAPLHLAKENFAWILEKALRTEPDADQAFRLITTLTDWLVESENLSQTADLNRREKLRGLFTSVQGRFKGSARFTVVLNRRVLPRLAPEAQPTDPLLVMKNNARTEALIPDVDEVDSQALIGLELEGLLFDFDETVWLGFPRDFAAKFLAAEMGVDTSDPVGMDRFRKFFLGAAGLSWDALFERARQEKWPVPSGMTEADYYRRLNPVLQAEILLKGLVAPEYLNKGVLELLGLLQGAQIRRAIATGADTDSRTWVTEQLNILQFFEPGSVHGYGNKKDSIQRQAKAWGVPPGKVALIGDSFNDVWDARQAGAIAVAYARTPEEREAFLRLPAERRPHLIINRDFSASKEILKKLRVRGFSAGTEEFTVEQKLGVVAEAMPGGQALAVQDSVFRRRPDLKEFLSRLSQQAGLEMVMLEGNNPVDWGVALAGLEAERVVFLGEQRAGELLRRILPELPITVLAPGAGLERVLLDLGLSADLLGQSNAAGVEQLLAGDRSA